MFIELPAFNPDRTSLKRAKCYVNLSHVTGIAKLNVQIPDPQTGRLLVVGEAWQFSLVGGGQILVDASANVAQLLTGRADARHVGELEECASELGRVAEVLEGASLNVK